MPSISIIMPCHNAVVHLPKSIGSIQKQTYRDWELIAVDDGSTDDTLTWLHAIDEPRVRVIAQPNQGVSAARNTGLRNAQGRYIAFLDADDTWAPTFLEKMFCRLEDDPAAVLAYCGWQNVGLPGPRGEPFVPPDYEGPGKMEILFRGCRWPIHAALVHAQALKQAGGFNPDLRSAEDYALWLEIATRGQIVRVPEVLAFYHFHGGGQASANRGRAALQHLEAQARFLRRHPDFARTLGRRRQLLYGELLQRGYECYWARDLAAARAIFRAVMRHGYGRPKDWLYMLPAWLPESWHRGLLALRAKTTSTRD